MLTVQEALWEQLPNRTVLLCVHICDLKDQQPLLQPQTMAFGLVGLVAWAHKLFFFFVIHVAGLPETSYDL